MARAVRFHTLGGPEVLRIEELQVAPPGADEVQIRARVLGLNRAEALMRAGNYIETPALPSGLGLEVAGTVEAVGDNVEGFEVGDAVSVVPPLSMIRWPAHAELVNFPAKLVVRNPASLGFEEAAAVWMQYLTAYGALIEIAKLRSAEFVIVTAASSSVGIAAIQIANRVGAIPIAVTRTAAKRSALLEVGAAQVITLADDDLQAGIRKITGSAGARVVFDPIGGPLLEPLTASMSRGGILIQYGALSLDASPFPLLTVLSKILTLRGYLVHEIVGDPARLEKAKSFILAGLACGALRPVIARKFPLSEIVEAHRFLESNEQFGKVIVTV